MDWFERLTGFREVDYHDTRGKLKLDGRALSSSVNDQSYGVGELDLASLGDLRQRVSAGGDLPGALTFRNITGDVRKLHRSVDYAGALFQVASQFNLLEMVGPNVSPEDGVTRYQNDRTQGPACAIAAGAATIYRNYFAPVGGRIGQTRERQLDGLADIGVALSYALGQPVETLWAMKNGYALCTKKGLLAIDAHLKDLDEARREFLTSLLRIGIHSEVEVTDDPGSAQQFVSQAFCSALPVAYTTIETQAWGSFAQLVLDAAYEATLWAGILNARRTGSTIVLLTRLGGGAFGNASAWIDAAIERALYRLKGHSLDIRLVNLGAPAPTMLALEETFVSR